MSTVCAAEEPEKPQEEGEAQQEPPAKSLDAVGPDSGPESGEDADPVPATGRREPGKPRSVKKREKRLQMLDIRKDVRANARRKRKSKERAARQLLSEAEISELKETQRLKKIALAKYLEFVANDGVSISSIRNRDDMENGQKSIEEEPQPGPSAGSSSCTSSANGPVKGQPSLLNVVINCSFCDDMVGKELTSLCKQIELSYNAFKNITEPPFKLHLTSFTHQTLWERLGAPIKNGNWRVTVHADDYWRVFEKRKVVILTPDAEEYLEEVTADKVYVVGGSVDREVKRGQTLEQSLEKACVVERARIPLKEFAPKGTRKILNIDTVVRMLALKCDGGGARRSETHFDPDAEAARAIDSAQVPLSWPDVFERVLPSTRQVVDSASSTSNRKNDSNSNAVAGVAGAAASSSSLDITGEEGELSPLKKDGGKPDMNLLEDEEEEQEAEAESKRQKTQKLEHS